ncbi:MAG: DUF2237 domain-containing protein [Pseudomonadota bacterium]|nr:DUF2237 domain-containing protein [Pseudomonadota bacterium]
MSLNIKGQPLETCSCEPMTGFYRDGLCRTDKDDRGRHVVCTVMTETFLSYSKATGNDLSTPRPEFDFPGLKAGDHWCLCALRWLQAYEAGMAPKVRLEATDHHVLQHVKLEYLLENAYEPEHQEEQSHE